MTHIPVWWLVLLALNIVCSLAVVALLCLTLRRRRDAPPESGYARQEATFSPGVDWGAAPPLGETLQTAPCPFADTCDRTTCRMEGASSMMAAEGGFGDPGCPKCGGPARMIESKVVTVPDEWRGLFHFADAITCDRCGFTTEGKVPYISLSPLLKDSPARLDAAVKAAAHELVKRVRECDELDRLQGGRKGVE